MSSLSVMEWNAKPPLLWEWDNLVSFNSRAPEQPKILHPADWGTEVEEGIDSGSLYSYGGNGGSSSATSFDLGYASLSKGSKSPSLNSSSAEDTKISKFSFEGREGYPEDFMGKKDLATAEFTGTSPTLESSVCSGEPLLSLKLGKRAYPDDVCEGSNVQTTMNSSIAKSPDPPKKTKPGCQNTPAPRCQVEGCNLDLSSAKDYHRKHRVCEHHSKSPKVIVNGIERRFCQQCSRFHGLSEFDEKKRSCRKRLSDHNARRRKPQPDMTQLNSTRLSNMLYGGMQQVNHVVSTGPIMHSHYTDNLTWVNTPGPKFMHAKGKILNPAEAEDGNKHLHVPIKGLPNAVRPSGLNNGSSCLISFKAAANNVLGGGSEGSFLSSKLDAPRDNQRALSLLSTDSRDSCRPRSISHNHSFHRNDIGISMCQPSVYGVSQSSTLASPDYWHAGHRPNSIQTSNLTPLNSFGNDNNFDDCILPVARRDLSYETVQLN